MYLGSAHVIIEKNKKILLTLRQDIPVWVIPGGRIEGGESPEKAASREIAEEVGYKIKIVALVGEYLIPGSINKKYLYVGKIIGGKKIKNNSEVRDTGWFNPDSPPIPMSIYEKNRLTDYKSFLIKGRVIKGVDNFNWKKEMLNQISNPILLVSLIPYLWNSILKKFHNGNT